MIAMDMLKYRAIRRGETLVIRKQCSMTKAMWAPKSSVSAPKSLCDPKLQVHCQSSNDEVRATAALASSGEKRLGKPTASPKKPA